MTRIILDSGGGVSYIAFVNAETNEVIPVEDDATARAFIAGEIATGDDIEDIGSEPISSNNGTQSQTTITIVQEDGSTEEIELETGSQIVIEKRE